MAIASKLTDMEPGTPISYRILAAALEHYELRGYGYLETPWVVSDEAIQATLPKNQQTTKTQYGNLVGSAEQGFIELLLRGKSITKACSISPCFRQEPSYDQLHHAYFIKLELFNTNATINNLDLMITDAVDFYENYIDTAVIKTGDNSYDIVDKGHGIELGSYGFRQAAGQKFLYGTGVALPRLDTVINL